MRVWTMHEEGGKEEESAGDNKKSGMQFPLRPSPLSLCIFNILSFISLDQNSNENVTMPLN